MPQLDSSTFFSQIFWLAVTFAGLYWAMAKVALPRLEQILADRRNRIDGDLEKAAQLKTETEAVIAAYEKALAEARGAAQATMREMTERLHAEAVERESKAVASIAEKTAAAEARIATAKDAALAELPQLAAELAGDTASRLLGMSFDPAHAAKAVKSVRKGAG